MQDTTLNYEQWKVWATMPDKQDSVWAGFDLEATEVVAPYISLYMTTPTVIFNGHEYNTISFTTTDLEVPLESVKKAPNQSILYWVSKSVENGVTSWTFRFVKLS
jgi:hypothetical protein